MFKFSKTEYCDFCECPKKAWLGNYKPEECCISDSSKARMEVGSEVGELSRSYFGDYVNVTVYDGDKLDLFEMIERTKAEIAKNTPVICEASFDFSGLYCAVAILRKENRTVIERLFRLNGGVRRDHDEIALEEYSTPAVVRFKEALALRRFRHPQRSKYLVKFFE